MSDRRPKVTVEQGLDGIEAECGRWVAKCHEPGCAWMQTPGDKTYTSQRAAAHRNDHRFGRVPRG